MEPVAAAEPAHVEILWAQLGRDSAVGEHRPGALGVDEGDDDAVPALGRDGAEQLDAPARELARDEVARAVGGALADESRLSSERGRPGGDVCRLAARTDTCLRVSLRIRPARAVRADDYVQQQVSEGTDEHP